MVHPTRGRREPVFGWDEVKEAASEQEHAERLRLYYVAMTRAIDRLVVSGAIDPGRTADRSTPIGWVLDRLEANDTVVEAGDAPIELERDEARFVLSVNRYEPRAEESAAEPEAAADDELQLALFGELPPIRPRLGIQLPSLAEIPAPEAHDVRRLSYSALALFERCSYRYFAERVLGLPPRERAASGADGAGRLAAHEIGDAVHRLLEHVALYDPVAPARDELDGTVRGWYAEVSSEELDRVATLVDAYCESDLARRMAGLAGARPERPFTFEHDDVVIRGRLDVLWREGEHALVVDYKSNALEGRTPAEIIDSEYTLQRLVYALVCLRAGANEVEVAYQFLEQPNDVVSTTFTDADVPTLEAELSAAIARIREGDFRPTPSEFVCADCPALDLVCAGPRLGLAR
jgi:ATP-dependent helicase/nuclease subunit A